MSVKFYVVLAIAIILFAVAAVSFVRALITKASRDWQRMGFCLTLGVIALIISLLISSGNDLNMARPVFDTMHDIFNTGQQ